MKHTDKDPTPVSPEAASANKKPTPHQHYLVSVRVTHPPSSWSVSATFHLMDPMTSTDTEAVNGPTYKRMLHFVDTMTSL